MAYKQISREKCFALWDKYNVPENVRKHSMQVEKVAVFLGERMKKNGEKVDLGLVSAGALLHDIGKIISLREGKKENIVSKKILGEEGLPVIGMIAFRHMISQIIDGSPFQWSLEEKIVYYADKRVMHDKIVGVRERIEDLIKRYPQGADVMAKSLPKILEMEKELLSKAKNFPGLEGLG